MLFKSSLNVIASLMPLFPQSASFSFNFAVAPDQIPVDQYIVETEKVCGVIDVKERE